MEQEAEEEQWEWKEGNESELVRVPGFVKPPRNPTEAGAFLALVASLSPFSPSVSVSPLYGNLLTRAWWRWYKRHTLRGRDIEKEGGRPCHISQLRTTTCGGMWSGTATSRGAGEALTISKREYKE